MKIRELKIDNQLKENEYVMSSANCGDLAIRLDCQKIYNLTYKIITTPTSLKNRAKDEEFKFFITENIEFLHNTIDVEIQYILDSLSLIFCSTNDDLRQIKRNFYKFNNKLEEMIALLISRNVKKSMLEKYKKEMNL